MTITTTNIQRFFQQLAVSNPIALIRGVTSSCRFDIHDIGCYSVIIDDGTLVLIENDLDINVNTIVSGDASIFNRLVEGKHRLMVAYLQGEIQVSGDVSGLVRFQRIFPPTIFPTVETCLPREHPVATIALLEDDQPLLSPSAPAQTVSILDGNTFVICDLRGDMQASPAEAQGLFSWDTRLLSCWKLKINGMTLRALSTDDLQYYAAQFFLVPSTGAVYIDSTLSIIRMREVGRGFHEQLTILNHAREPIDLHVKIEVGSDFADLFEVKDKVAKKGTYYHREEAQRLVLGYQRERFQRETWIECSGPVSIHPDALHFAVHIQPHGQWTTNLDVIAANTGVEQIHEDVLHERVVKTERQNNVKEWIKAAPLLSCQWPELERIYQQSLLDMAALRFFSKSCPSAAMPAAGLPWFMTIFGRDSLIASLQSLPFFPDLAVATLRVLATHQGCQMDDFRDEEPGKIIHEVRFGELTAFEERPHSPYFGSVDSTPLFLILLDEAERWSGNTQLVQQLEWNARAALNWIDKYGDHNGDGYVDYQRRNTKSGLENQGWKDSWNSILFADGSLARSPVALCEVQGYVYDAKLRCARLARTFWHDSALADRLEKDAVALKQRFNRDFWLEDREYFALAIDGEGRKVDSLTSNIGHLLWSGIVDEDKVGPCVRHLMSDRLFSGWGVRTMAVGDGGYNPIGYHNGTVWPHDNSIIALGLTRQGYRKEALQIATAMLEAAIFFNNCLPEVFAGYDRKMTEYPVEYPTACRPQAWATGTPLLLLRALLGLEPVGDQLLVNPALPEKAGWLMLLNIPGRWGKADAFGRGRRDGLCPPHLI